MKFRGSSENIRDKLMNNKNMIFTMTCSYSGHTLLSLFLDSHPQLSDLGDTILPLYSNDRPPPCKCGKNTNECDFWKAISTLPENKTLQQGMSHNLAYKAIFSMPQFYSLQKLLLKFSPYLQRYVKNIISYNNYITEQNGTDYLLYGKKRLQDYFIALSHGMPLKVIHLTKHPIAFVHSSLKRKEKSHSDIRSASKLWLRYNSTILRSKTVFPSIKYIHIKYEDFCANPENTIKDLCSFIGVPFFDSMLNPEESKHHMIGSYSIITRKFENIKLPDLNDNSISEDDSKIILEITGKLAHEMGYTFS